MPADHAAVPPPEWAVEMAFAHTFPADCKASGYAEARRLWAHIEGTADWRRLDRLASMLASVRESALHEAAAVGYHAAAPGGFPETPCGVQGNVMDAILALIDEPPGNIP